VSEIAEADHGAGRLVDDGERTAADAARVARDNARRAYRL
jgi:hypothetical protein